MDERRIIIAKLSKGRLGEAASNLIGSLLVTAGQLAAMGRSGVPEAERQDFVAFLDEFHNFATDAFASMLAESRKYRLALVIGHQYLDQGSRPVRAAQCPRTDRHAWPSAHLQHRRGVPRARRGARLAEIFPLR